MSLYFKNTCLQMQAIYLSHSSFIFAFRQPPNNTTKSFNGHILSQIVENENALFVIEALPAPLGHWKTENRNPYEGVF
jgi:hypothetical protein